MCYTVKEETKYASETDAAVYAEVNVMCNETREKIRALEETLRYLIRPGMSIDEKLKALRDSYWRSHNAGYCDYIAGMQMGGITNGQTEQHDLDCRYKYEVERLIDLLEELKKES